MVVAPADTGTRPVPARASVMAAAEALLEYASVYRTDNDRESFLWGSAGKTEAIELGDRGRLQIGAQRGSIIGGVKITEGADRRNNSITVKQQLNSWKTELPSDDVAAYRGWNQWSTGDLLTSHVSHNETGFAIIGARINSSSSSWNARHPGVSDRDLDYFVLKGQRRKFEFEKLRQQRRFAEWKQEMEEERRSAEAHVIVFRPVSRVICAIESSVLTPAGSRIETQSEQV